MTTKNRFEVIVTYVGSDLGPVTFTIEHRSYAHAFKLAIERYTNECAGTASHGTVINKSWSVVLREYYTDGSVTDRRKMEVVSYLDGITRIDDKQMTALQYWKTRLGLQ